MPESKKKVTQLVTGVEVKIKGYGKGLITKVDPQESADGGHEVFHVLLENGDTRHFVGSLLEV